MQQAAYDNPRKLSHPRLRRAMWIVIAATVISTTLAMVIHGMTDGETPAYQTSWVLVVLLFASPLAIVGAINVLAWIRVAPWLSSIEMAYRIIVIVCLATLFTVLSFFAALLLFWLLLIIS